MLSLINRAAAAEPLCVRAKGTLLKDQPVTVRDEDCFA